MTLRPAQAALAEVLRAYAIREGEFTLASGRTTAWYLDGRQVSFRGDCLKIVGEAVVDALAASGIGTDDFDAVGGPVVGAIPVALGVALVTGKPSFAIAAPGRLGESFEPGHRSEDHREVDVDSRLHELRRDNPQWLFSAKAAADLRDHLEPVGSAHRRREVNGVFPK